MFQTKATSSPVVKDKISNDKKTAVRSNSDYDDDDDNDEDDGDEESDTSSSYASSNSSSPSIRILCLNCFLIPPSISWNPYFWAVFWTCKNPGKRARQIGELAKKYDLVCLQEVWGTHMNSLNNFVSATHSILPECESSFSTPWISEMIDPIRFFLNRNGGLWSAWRRSKLSFKALKRRMFEPEGQVPFANQNITMVEYSGVGGLEGYDLFAFNTHFSVFGTSGRASNLRCVEEFIRVNLWKMYLYNLAFGNNSSSSNGINGNTYNDDNSKDPDHPKTCNIFNNTGVLLVGDFNIDYRRCPGYYDDLLTLNNTAKIRDLFLPRYNSRFYSQKTYYTQESNNPYLKTGNSLFPWKFHGRVDYILCIDELYISAPNVIKLLRQYPPEKVLIDCRDKDGNNASYEYLSSLQIPALDDSSLTLYFNKLKCSYMDILKQDYGAELSDHWALSCSVEFGESDPFDNNIDYTIRRKVDTTAEIKEAVAYANKHNKFLADKHSYSSLSSIDAVDIEGHRRTDIDASFPSSTSNCDPMNVGGGGEGANAAVAPPNIEVLMRKNTITSVIPKRK